MIATQNISLSYSGKPLFKNVNIKFTAGNCYGIIGANGTGKSTFLKVLSGELEPTTGEVVITPGERMAVLRQNHFEFDSYEVLQTVIMGHKRLYEIMKEKDELYAKEDFTDADGERASELEGEFAELDGIIEDLAWMFTRRGVWDCVDAVALGLLERGRLGGDRAVGTRRRLAAGAGRHGRPDRPHPVHPHRDHRADTALVSQRGGHDQPVCGTVAETARPGARGLECARLRRRELPARPGAGAHHSRHRARGHRAAA